MGNVRLLALSGLGEQYDPHTGKGMLGKNLTCHINIVSAQIFVDKPMNRFMGAASSGIRLGDLDGDCFDHSGVPFLRGGNFGAMGSGYQPITTFGTIPADKERNWGSAWKKKSMEHYDKWGFINFAGEHLPYRDNYFDLDPTYQDVFGDPLLRLTLNWNPNEHLMMDWAVEKSMEMARAMGAVAANPFQPYKDFDLTRLSMTHTQGGAIMGASPDNSYVNTYQQSWETDNLFVVGNSALPQQGSSNPTLTLLGLCYRTADAIVSRYAKSPGPLA
jgi:gluconate 2-dehydrogenase alpha chain